MAGKIFLLKNTRLYINQYDMSGLSRTLDSLVKSFEKVDMTAWDYNVSRAMGNRCEVGIMGYGALLDIDTGKSLDALQENQDAHVSLLIGAGAAPAVGDLAYIVPGIQFGGLMSIETGAVGFSGIDFIPEPGQAGAYYISPYGVVLEIATSRTATQTGSSVNNAAATTAGWSAMLHVISSGANWEIKIQHSANDTDWADLTTFTADGSTALAEHKSAATTVNQYTRILSTRTSGNLTVVCVLARN